VQLQSPTKPGAPYLAFFWRDVGGMYQAQRTHGQIEGDRPLGLMLCIRARLQSGRKGLKNDELLAPATAWIRKKYEFFNKLFSRAASA
jgi:hypothetical protein